MNPDRIGTDQGSQDSCPLRHDAPAMATKQWSGGKHGAASARDGMQEHAIARYEP